MIQYQIIRIFAGGEILKEDDNPKQSQKEFEHKVALVLGIIGFMLSIIVLIY
jgi:hypothetical protein